MEIPEKQNIDLNTQSATKDAITHSNGARYALFSLYSLT